MANGYDTSQMGLQDGISEISSVEKQEVEEKQVKHGAAWKDFAQLENWGLSLNDIFGRPRLKQMLEVVHFVTQIRSEIQYVPTCTKFVRFVWEGSFA